MFMNNFVWDEKPPAFEVSDGEHRVKVLKVYDGNSKNDKACVNFLLQVEGANCSYVHSIWIGNEYTNRNFTSFFLAFGLQAPPNTDDWANYYGTWCGKYGKAMFHHKQDSFTDRNGVQRTVTKCELHYLIAQPKQGGTAPQKNVVVPASPKQPRSIDLDNFPEDLPGF